MFCKSCGNPIPEHARFCTKCGAPISAAPRKQSSVRFLLLFPLLLLAAAAVWLGLRHWNRKQPDQTTPSLQTIEQTTRKSDAVSKQEESVPDKETQLPEFISDDPLFPYYYAAYKQNVQSYMGTLIDPDVPLNQQAYPNDTYETWDAFLQDGALAERDQYHAIYQAANANGYELSSDLQSSMDAELENVEQLASMTGYEDANAYLVAAYGRRCNLDSYKDYLTVTHTVSGYTASVYESFSYTTAERNSYYEKHRELFDFIDFRILSLTDKDAKNDAINMAEAAFGDEEAFLDLAKQHFADEDINADTATLCCNYSADQCPDASKHWLFDRSRQFGDTTAIEEANGSWHVLFYLQRVVLDDPLPCVRHILIAPEDDSKDAWTAAEAEAQQILDHWKNNGATEEAFAKAAKEYSDDGGSADTGGLYENILPGQMIQEFDSWCFEPNRQPEDSGLIKTAYGYHIMYFSGFSYNSQLNILIDNAMRERDYALWLETVLDT